jgi:hypothetical protein
VSFDVNRLYELLPAFIRIRDTEQAGSVESGPLRALLSLIAEQTAVLEEDPELLTLDPRPVDLEVLA